MEPVDDDDVDRDRAVVEPTGRGQKLVLRRVAVTSHEMQPRLDNTDLASLICVDAMGPGSQHATSNSGQTNQLN